MSDTIERMEPTGSEPSGMIEGEVLEDGTIRLIGGTLPKGAKVWAICQDDVASKAQHDIWVHLSLQTLARWARENPF